MYLCYYICLKTESSKTIDYAVTTIFCSIDILFNMTYKLGVKYNHLKADCIYNLQNICKIYLKNKNKCISDHDLEILPLCLNLHLFNTVQTTISYIYTHVQETKHDINDNRYRKWLAVFI